jgi:hypothetical protein
VGKNLWERGNGGVEIGPLLGAVNLVAQDNDQVPTILDCWSALMVGLRQFQLTQN